MFKLSCDEAHLLPFQSNCTAMPDNQITFRTDPRVKARIAELVGQGEYRNTSEFMNQAILLKFQVERVLLDGEPVGPDPIAEFLQSVRGRELLRELLREAREG
jgi:Arc/MetJ-type ribon-helix-helix transcriptional regulator